MTLPSVGDRIEIDDHSVEWWREHELAESRFYAADVVAKIREARRSADLASYTLRGDPDATPEERERAKVEERCAFAGIAKLEAEQEELEHEVERLTSAPPPASGREPARASAPRVRLRGIVVVRPRERRGGRRRSASRAGPDSEDPEPAPSRRRLTQPSGARRRQGAPA